MQGQTVSTISSTTVIVDDMVVHDSTTIGSCTTPSRGVLATWTGGQRGGTPAPRPDRAPPPKKGTRYTLKDSIGLNPHPETLRDYRSKPTIIQLVDHIRT